MITRTTKARPGGRSARVRADVHRAVRELLVEESDEVLTLPVIANRAGVHPTTLYRRWGSVSELLGDVATSRFSGAIVVPDTGSLREDLERWIDDVATDLTDPDVLALVRAAVGSDPEGGRACTRDRHAQLTAMLDRERSRGGSAPDVERATDALLGPLYYRAIFTEGTLESGWARELVKALLD